MKTCEDGIVEGTDFVAVIDGSTSKGLHPLETDMRNGRYAMLVLSSVIKELEKDTSIESFVALATEAFRKEYQKHKIDTAWLQRHPEERLCASVVVYARARQEIWMIGDCQCMIDSQIYDNPKRSEAQIAAERATEAKRLLDKGITISELQQNDLSRTAILPLLIRCMKDENIEYSVIDGFPVPMSKTRLIGCAGAKQVILASDGYPFLQPSLAQSEEALARQLHTDPLNIDTFKATKGFMTGNVSFDDRAYVRLEV